VNYRIQIDFDFGDNDPAILTHGVLEDIEDVLELNYEAGLTYENYTITVYRIDDNSPL
jgi:hypothetical protein